MSRCNFSKNTELQITQSTHAKQIYSDHYASGQTKKNGKEVLAPQTDRSKTSIFYYGKTSYARQQRLSTAHPRIDRTSPSQAAIPARTRRRDVARRNPGRRRISARYNQGCPRPERLSSVRPSYIERAAYALKTAKQLINRGVELPLKDALALERKMIAEMATPEERKKAQDQAAATQRPTHEFSKNVPDRQLSKSCSVRDLDPGGRMVARFFPAADFAIDACADQTRRCRRTQQQMFDAQARIARIIISEVIPKSVDALIWMQLAQRVSP